MNPLIYILLTVVLFGLAWSAIGLFMILPGKKRPCMEKYRSVKFAHRGLHDSERPENSMSAFVAAKEKGFGIELDLHLSKDGELVVFHDDNLSRMVGKDGKISDFTAEELAKMHLVGTKDTIPTFKEVLDLIDGSVPLLIELKVAIGEKGVVEKFVDVIDGYKGDFIVESFNPMALKELKKLRPDILRGILSSQYMKDPKYKGKLVYRLAQNLQLNFLMRPDFIAYEKEGFGIENLRFIRRNFNTPLLAWTIKSPEEEAAAISHGFDTVIFEGYIPGK